MEMKSKMFMLLCAFSFAGGVVAGGNVAFDYDVHWKKVDKLSRNLLPESALREVDLIFDEAQRTGNFAQLAKAAGRRIGLLVDKEADAAPDAVRAFEQLCDTGRFAPADEAVMRSMLAELYGQLYSNDRYTIDQRTPTPGYVPEYLAHWSRYNYVDKVLAELERSLASVEVLHGTSLDAYEPLLLAPGEKALTPCRPDDLYSFLLRRAINILGNMGDDEAAYQRITGWYEQLEATARLQGDTTALVLTSLDRLAYEHRHATQPDRDDRYQEALRQLCRRYADHESVLEAQAVLAEQLLNGAYRSGQQPDDHMRQAYDLCAEGMARYPHYARINLLHNLQARITKKEIAVDHPAVVRPHGPLALRINSRNVGTLQVKVYRVQATAEEYYTYTAEHSPNDSYPLRKEVLRTTLVTTPDSLFLSVNDTLVVQTDDYGIYEYEVYETGYTKGRGVARGSFVVSDLALLQRREDDKPSLFYVLDRMSGAPVPQAELHLYDQVWVRNHYKLQPKGRLTTDSTGFGQVRNYQYWQPVFVKKGADAYLSSNLYAGYRPANRESEDMVLSLFSDRSLYRPGQLVQFKGIAYRPKGQEVVADTDFEVTLVAANGKEVERKRFRSNEFGSFSGTFLLPEQGLGGVYRLQSKHGSLSFRVEEYKCPTFEVIIDTLQQETAFDRPVTLTGCVRSYAGHALSQAEVHYTVTRRTHRWWFLPSLPDRVVAADTLTAGANGRFSITFTPERVADGSLSWCEQYYMYNVEVVATSAQGETQTAERGVTVGDRLLHLQADLPDKVKKDSPLRVALTAETLNGATPDTEVHYVLQRLTAPAEYREALPADYAWTVEAEVFSGTHRTQAGALTLDLTRCQPGNYRLVCTARDSRGQEVKAEASFVLYDLQADCPR